MSEEIANESHRLAVSAIEVSRIGSSTEMQMHDDVESALEAAGVAFIREKELSQRDRIDFLTADGLGIECKIDGSPTEVARQLIRYAESREVLALVLVTSRSRLGGSLPETINGKLITVVTTWRSAL